MRTDLGTLIDSGPKTCLIKDLQFWVKFLQTFSNRSSHGLVNLSKYEQNWTRIVDFSIIPYFLSTVNWGAQVCILHYTRNSSFDKSWKHWMNSTQKSGVTSHESLALLFFAEKNKETSLRILHRDSKILLSVQYWGSRFLGGFSSSVPR